MFICESYDIFCNNFLTKYIWESFVKVSFYSSTAYSRTTCTMLAEICHSYISVAANATQRTLHKNMKFSINDFLSKCDQWKTSFFVQWD